MNDIRSEAEQTAKSIDAQQAEDSKTAFFDAIADQWDGFQGDMAVFRKTLAQGLREIGVGESETVLDLGCGTGNLTGVLLDHLSDEGRVVAVDISPCMLAQARRKVVDSRVEWIQADAARLDLSDGYFDRIICFCVWPHFDNCELVARELYRLLRTEGSLDIWHPISRAQVNEIHATASQAVSGDLLAPAIETAALLERIGFKLLKCVDDESRYLVSATKSVG